MNGPLRNIKAIASWVIRGSQLRAQPAYRPDDIHIVSYPKSGNTWVRYIIASLLSNGRQIQLNEMDRLVPDEEDATSRRMSYLPSPRFIKSHQPLNVNFRRVIYIVRDPRDVLVSYYHHARKFSLIHNAEDIDSFAHRCLDGSFDPYGTWHEHVGGWVGARDGDTQFLRLRYENMLLDRLEAVRRISSFCGLLASESTLQSTYEASSFDAMRKVEEQTGKKWRPNARSKDQSPFVRAGTSGSGKCSLSLQVIKRITSECGRVMTACGYDS